MGFLEFIRKISVRNVPGNLFWFGSGSRGEEDDCSRSLPALLSKIPAEVNTEHLRFFNRCFIDTKPS